MPYVPVDDSWVDVEDTGHQSDCQDIHVTYNGRSGPRTDFWLSRGEATLLRDLLIEVLGDR